MLSDLLILTQFWHQHEYCHVGKKLVWLETHVVLNKNICQFSVTYKFLEATIAHCLPEEYSTKCTVGEKLKMLCYQLITWIDLILRTHTHKDAMHEILNKQSFDWLKIDLHLHQWARSSDWCLVFEWNGAWNKHTWSIPLDSHFSTDYDNTNRPQIESSISLCISWFTCYAINRECAYLTVLTQEHRVHSVHATAIEAMPMNSTFAN